MDRRYLEIHSKKDLFSLLKAILLGRLCCQRDLPTLPSLGQVPLIFLVQRHLLCLRSFWTLGFGSEKYGIL